MAEEKKKRGFALMTPEQRSRIAMLGGKQASANGNSHKWTAEEAKQAGLKGAAKRYGNKPKLFD